MSTATASPPAGAPSVTTPTVPLPARLLERDDLCAIFGVTYQTLKRWVREGVIPPPLGVGRRAKWHPSTIDAFLKSGKQP